MNRYMNSINEFKNYATSIWMPDYFREYVNELDEEKLDWFYHQVKDALEFLTSADYLIYKFNWIKEYPFTDLSKEIYLHTLYNPEFFTFDLIKPECEKVLEDKYKDDEDVKRYFRQFF